MIIEYDTEYYTCTGTTVWWESNIDAHLSTLTFTNFGIAIFLSMFIWIVIWVIANN